MIVIHAKNIIIENSVLGLPFDNLLVQFIASAPTLFPAEYVQEFQNCFDRAPAVPFHEIEVTLSEELQRPLDSIYEYIDPVPIASASIAQVYQHVIMYLVPTLFCISVT